jgi:excisionase family DNA binding protein
MSEMSNTPDDPAPQVRFMPPQPPLGERERGNFARAALALQHSIEHAAAGGDQEARDVLAHEARELLKRWGRSPPRKRRPPRDGALLLNAEDAAALLGVSVDTLRRWASDGTLPRVRMPRGGSRYARPNLEALILKGATSCPSAAAHPAAGSSTSGSTDSASARRSPPTSTASASGRLRPWNASDARSSKRSAEGRRTASARLRLVTGTSTGGT